MGSPLGGASRELLLEVVEAFEREVVPVDGKLRRQVIHGDANFDNIVLNAAGDQVISHTITRFPAICVGVSGMVAALCLLSTFFCDSTQHMHACGKVDTWTNTRSTLNRGHSRTHGMDPSVFLCF
jgi:hypothetical protein